MQGEAPLVVGVDELVRGGRRFCQDAEPGEGIATFEGLASERRPRDTVRAVAAGNELAIQARRFSVALVADLGMVILDPLDPRRLRLEPDLAAIRQALLDQVLDDLLLAVDDDAATGQPVSSYGLGSWPGRLGP